MPALLTPATCLEPDLTGDLIDLYRREQFVKPLLAARIAGVTVEQLRDDHAVGRLPPRAAINALTKGFCFDIDLICTHYHGEGWT